MTPDDEKQRERRRRLVEELRGRPVTDQRILDAMLEVPRHSFVPCEIVPRAYDNVALPIDEGQTISQPLIVALMSDALRLRGPERVLEIGTGSGYQAAILSRLAREVHTVERSAALWRQASDRLRDLGHDNVVCHLGDGTLGLPAEGPFDAIMVTAAGPSVPPPLLDQLTPQGRIVAPVGSRSQQVLRRVTLSASGPPREETISHVVFVPLIGEHGWPG